MINHPAKFYAKFYLSRKTHSYEGVVGLLGLNGVGGMSEDDVAELDSEMRYPRPFRPEDLTHRKSQRFLRREGIYEAWHPGKDMNIALSVLATMELRHLVEMFILSPVKPEQAVPKINRKLNPEIKLTVRAYELFQHYFWNRDLMSASGWGKFIEESEAANEEWLRLAIDARGPSGVQMLLWKTGTGALRKLEANKAFTDTRNIAFMMVQQIAMMPPSKNHSEMLRNYVQVMKMAQEGADSSAAGIKDVAQAFNAFRMRHRETQTASIQQVTGGNFSQADQGVGDEEKLEYD